MKPFKTTAFIFTLLSIAFLSGCKSEPKESEENAAPVITETLIRYRHAHDEYWDSADLYVLYNVHATDSFGDDDIVYLSIKDCDTCDESILKNITSADESAHVNLFDDDYGYYKGGTYWYGSDNLNRRPATFIVYARDKAGLETTQTINALKPDLTEVTSETFAYAEAYVGSDTADGFPALALPTGSSVSFGSSVFNITFNTNDINAKKVVVYFYNVSDEYVGNAVWTEGEFAANTDNTVNHTDYYIDDAYTETDVNYVHIYSESGRKAGTQIDYAPHHAFSAKISVSP